MFLAAALVVGGAATGFVTLRGASVDIDASTLATVERGTMVRSVVATGKVEPMTKIEIKSKANGIIKALRVNVDSVVTEGDVLVELDKDQLLAQQRGAEANLLAARAALEGAEAQLKKNSVEAEGPDVAFARRAFERAQSLFEQQLIPQASLDDAHSAVDVAENKRRAAPRSRNSSSARPVSPRRVRRWPRPGPPPTAPPKTSRMPPSARRSGPPSSHAMSRWAARSPRSSTSAPTPRS